MSGVETTARSDDRRTHGVFRTEEEAREAAYDLAYLMRGVPFGYVFFVQKRMGAWVFFSAKATGAA